MGAKFTLQISEVEALKKQINVFQGKVEDTINDYLHHEGKDILVENITKYTPISDRKKKHAKNSKPYHTINRNLSAIIESKSGFRYLYFPDAGAGTSKMHPRHEEFMQDGVDASHNKIVNDLLKVLERKL